MSTESPAVRLETASVRRTSTRAFLAMLLRDVRVVRKNLPAFLMRTVTQPLLFVFVFAYVFPKIGQGIGGAEGADHFATLLLPGMVAIACIFQGIQSVTLPLVSEFGYTREIEDRVLAPLPVWVAGLAKVVSGALQAALASVIVFPLVLLVSSADITVRVDWPTLLTIGPLACCCAGSIGLALGTRIEPRQVSLMFSIIILPMTMLGAVYYPWVSLDAIPWLKWLVLLNPLVYISEGFRMSLTGLDHMSGWAIYGALLGSTALLLRAGLEGFRRRVLT